MYRLIISHETRAMARIRPVVDTGLVIAILFAAGRVAAASIAR
jgi:hypothetical protein